MPIYFWICSVWWWTHQYQILLWNLTKLLKKYSLLSYLKKTRTKFSSDTNYYPMFMRIITNGCIELKFEYCPAIFYCSVIKSGSPLCEMIGQLVNSHSTRMCSMVVIWIETLIKNKDIIYCIVSVSISLVHWCRYSNSYFFSSFFP